jgi:cysteine desulfurase
LAYLEKNGWKITYLDVDEQGFINIKQLFKNIQKDTVLISIMHANNEMGSIQNISETGRELLKYRKQNNTCFPYFHTDACQSAGFLNLDVEKLHVDLVTINSSKIYGPKGVGMLYIRNKVKIEPIIFGGHQENRLRAGTQNMPGIVGFAKAFELASKNKEKESKRLRILTEYFWKQIKNTIPKVILNGPEIGDQRLPNNLNITFLDIEGEAMLLYLDEYGIMCGTGSACTSDSLEPSHVLTAMGRPYEHSHGSIRFSLGKCNNKKDIDYTMKYLPKIIKHLREMSPVNLKIKNI